jgi:hypothetical protein
MSIGENNKLMNIIEIYKKSTIILFLLIVGLSHISFAQLRNPTPRIEVGVHGSMFVYQGDLTSYKFGSRKTSSFGFGAFASFRFNESFSLRANFANGKLEGDDEKHANPRHARKFNFSTPVTEFAGLLVWDVLGMGDKETNPNFFPYLMAGVGYTFLDINRDYSKNTYGQTHPFTIGLQEDIKQELPSELPVAMVGLGARHYLMDNLAANAEFMWRFTSNDYLDGFSQSADPNNNDSYYVISAGLIYSFKRSQSKSGGGNFKKGKGRRGKIDCPVYE